MNHQLENEIRGLTSGAMPLPGWCSPEKALHIASIILENHPKVCVELGVFGGRSFVPMVLALDLLGGDSMAYGIDAWSNAAALEGMDPHDADGKANIDYWSRMNMAAIMAKVAGYLEERKLFGRAALIQARAENVATLFAPESIDCLHVDGNHTELASCRDVRLWLPRVRKGGWVFFDDTNWASTQPAQRLLEKDCRLVSSHPLDGQEYRLYQKN